MSANRKFRVTFVRTCYESAVEEVEASTEEEAREKANEIWEDGDLCWDTDDFGDEEISDIAERPQTRTSIPAPSRTGFGYKGTNLLLS